MAGDHGHDHDDSVKPDRPAGTAHQEPGRRPPEERSAEKERAGPGIRTGADQPWEPEDLAKAEGHDPTPENVERARQELEEEGPAAIERTVP